MEHWFQYVRLLVIFLGCISMWSLWVARRERKHLWTSKLRKIWMCQLGWSVAAVEGNIELYYRHAQPSLAIFLVVALLILTIAGVFDPSKYTVDQP